MLLKGTKVDTFALLLYAQRDNDIFFIIFKNMQFVLSFSIYGWKVLDVRRFPRWEELPNSSPNDHEVGEWAIMYFHFY